jgi:hypothetical protein
MTQTEVLWDSLQCFSGNAENRFFQQLCEIDLDEEVLMTIRKPWVLIASESYGDNM